MQTIAELFAARVPRYTSYPTAPHFHSGIDSDIYRGWLQALSEDVSLSLYVHIPFCDSLCWFCGCHTTVVNRYQPVSSYLDVLSREIAVIADNVPRGCKVTHLHWGGGSPTMLRPTDILQLNHTLRSAFAFAADAEFAVEIDPRGFDLATAEALATAGLTRASIGVQDCDPIVQRSINRIQPAAITAHAVRMLRDVGVKSLNIDLIYGLPHQTLAGIENTIDEVLQLAPDRLAIFGYAHVPHFKKHQTLIPESDLPGVGARFEQAEGARARLCAAGYAAIGLDHFAKPDDGLAIAQRNGTLARNFQGYTTDAAVALIGLGASAISSLPQGYAQNIADVPGYRAEVLNRRLPIARGIALATEDRVRRDVIERLMCDLRVDLRQVSDKFHCPPSIFAQDLARLKPLERRGIVVVDGLRLQVPETWRAVTRLVCAAFDAYLAEGAGQHALAV